MKVVGRCGVCGGTVVEDPERIYCLMCGREVLDKEEDIWTRLRDEARRRPRAIGSDHVGNGNQRKRERAREGLE